MDVPEVKVEEATPELSLKIAAAEIRLALKELEEVDAHAIVHARYYLESALIWLGQGCKPRPFVVY